MKPRTSYNPKRKIVPWGEVPDAKLARLAKACRYTGSPHHKKDPGDFELTPPARPRPGKTLCDGARVVRQETAESLLREGFKNGMISQQRAGRWPQNVWAVSDEGEVFEAQLENRQRGEYHGYPLPHADSFRNTVLQEWRERSS